MTDVQKAYCKKNISQYIDMPKGNENYDILVDLSLENMGVKFHSELSWVLYVISIKSFSEAYSIFLNAKDIPLLEETLGVASMINMRTKAFYQYYILRRYDKELLDLSSDYVKEQINDFLNLGIDNDDILSFTNIKDTAFYDNKEEVLELIKNNG